MTPAVSDDPKRRWRVLVVDDNPDYANSLCQFLNLNEGWEAEAAYGFGEAISQARRLRPDAVLLDLQIPPSSGFNVADAFDQAFPDCLPAIFAVSGNPELIERAHSDPRFLRTVLKPADPALLVQWLTELALKKR